MKKMIYTLVSLFLLASCTSIQKLVDRGEYDEAIVLAAKKLQGKKKKKTKHIVYLEEAFAKVMQRDLDEIDRLERSSDPQKWDRIFKIYSAIDRRQDRISPFLPLISKDGYVSHFKFIKAGHKLNEIGLKAAESHYENGLEELARAEHGDKLAAQEAYSLFKRAANYIPNYKDLSNLTEHAIDLGQTKVLVRIYNSSNSIIPSEFQEDMLDLEVQDMDNLWTKYYTHKEGQQNFDFLAIMDIERLEISPEREEVFHYDEVKEIEDGFEYVLDDDGNVLKDSLGNDIQVKKFKNIKAHVTEIILSKEAQISGTLLYRDFATGENLISLPMTVEAVFDDFSCSFYGDRRALSSKYKKRIKHNPSPFPSDFGLVLRAANELKIEMKRELIAGL